MADHKDTRVYTTPLLTTHGSVEELTGRKLPGIPKGIKVGSGGQGDGGNEERPFGS